MISFKQFITEQERISFKDSKNYYFFLEYFKNKKYNNEIIDVDDSVNLRTGNLTEIPWKFGRVEVRFECNRNKLTSLKNSPTYVGTDFRCQNNNLTSFEHCPEYVGDEIWAWNNKITSLVGIHKQIKHCTSIDIERNPIEEGGLGLLLIDGLISISSNLYPLQIIEKYLGQGKKGMMQCHVELVENGYEAYAKL